MAAFDHSLIARSEATISHLAKRNFAQEEPGVILVFCIIGVIAILLLALFINRKLQARKDRAPA